MSHVRAGIAWLICLVGLCSFAAAQGGKEPNQDEMKANKEKKLAADFFKKAKWMTDYDKAREEAKTSGKPIFAYFTRSYAY